MTDTAHKAQIELLIKELETADDCLFCYPEPIGRKHDETCTLKKILRYVRELEKKQSIMIELLEEIKSCETEIECVSECHFKATQVVNSLFPTISE